MSEDVSHTLVMVGGGQQVEQGHAAKLQMCVNTCSTLTSGTSGCALMGDVIHVLWGNQWFGLLPP